MKMAILLIFRILNGLFPPCVSKGVAFASYWIAIVLFNYHHIERSKNMKVVYVAMMAIASIVMTGQAQADEALAKSKNCMGCHAIDKKLVGPAFKEVAAKYKDDKQAVALLAAKIKAGGKGNWGPIPMPPNNVTEEEAQKLAVWVMAQK